MAGEKILLIDDETDFIQLLALDIKKKGYQVVTAGNGEEGLEKARSEKPDVIIFDIKMPKMDGYTFVRYIRKDPDLSPIPLIALTSYDMRDVFEMEGVNDYFLKSEKVDVLFEAIARCCSERK